MKKGFTLIELLGVVVVLGALVLIAMPTIKNVLNRNTDELYQRQIDGIEESARTWAAKHIGSLPDEGGSIEVTLGDLKRDGDAKGNLINPKTDEPFDDDSTKVIIRNINGNFNYTVVVE